jgi:hypothetical protein
MLTRREFVKIAGIGVGAFTLSSCGLGPTNEQQAPVQSLPSFPRAASTGKVHEYTFQAAPAHFVLNGNMVST